MEQEITHYSRGKLHVGQITVRESARSIRCVGECYLTVNGHYILAIYICVIYLMMILWLSFDLYQEKSLQQPEWRENRGKIWMLQKYGRIGRDDKCSLLYVYNVPTLVIRVFTSRNRGTFHTYDKQSGFL
jgi:hypothetical protein